jgi:hypothetical protein
MNDSRGFNAAAMPPEADKQMRCVIGRVRASADECVGGVWRS